MRILLAEDDTSLGATLQSWLQLDGYAVDWVKRGDHAETALRAQPYQCLLLDLGLPGVSGDRLLSGLRAHGNDMPVLLITARDALSDRIAGLDLGADDYLVKPFDLEELSARIRAAIRRGSGQATGVLRHGSIVLDPAGKQVTQNGATVVLTAREFAILHALMLHGGRPVSRDRLEDALYGWGEEVESNTVEVHIYHLRKKLGHGLIRTMRGLGYVLESP